MPEYLAPGVYVEEIPSANKPIQAASTSTAGMVGMTARGPVNRPTLVTSRGAYARIFGGMLDPRVFTDGRDALPYAVEGFFDNGGKNLFVIRILGPTAAQAQLRLVASDTRVTARPQLAFPALAGATGVLLANTDGLTPATRLLITGGTATEVIAIAEAPFEPFPVVGTGLVGAHDAGAVVRVQQRTALGSALTQPLEIGATEIVLDDADGITEGATLFLEDASDEPADHELVAVQAIDGTTLVLVAPLRRAHEMTAALSSLEDGSPATTLEVAVGPSSLPAALDLVDSTGVDAGEVVRIGEADAAELAIVTGAVDRAALVTPLVHGYASGAALTPAVEVLTAHARWPGVWGNSLRVTADAQALVETVTTSITPANSTSLSLATAFGLYPGSVVTLPGGVTAEVAEVDTDSATVTLTAAPGAEIPVGPVASQEFGLLVERVEDGKVVESERFDGLSLAPAHPRYAPTIVGGWDVATNRPSESGAAEFVRLTVLATAQTRAMPLIPGVPRPLSGGTDEVAQVLDGTYVGTPAEDPDARTGIQAMENESTLSIVAVPGQVSLTVQHALVAHCEKMRFRFAVLDVPLGGTLDAARAHRQHFDTTRAAIYYPGVSVADRFGAPGDRRTIPASGHVIGVYARTDLTRGVHKAPANEVLNGVLGLRTALTKGEQDILNPINLNCLRDFRSEFRGLRVYGARVATSAPEWRYVNVRRLLLFIEQSLDTGLQWAVFEPNDKPLWDTVKQSITGFLATVWRSGALEGGTQEEAFFVNIGYDVTMTQADIDNGLLIVEVGVAPVKPAEFVVVRISQKTREATA